MLSRHSGSSSIRIYEYQAGDLLQRYGITVPKGVLARSGQEASAAAGAWPAGAVIKAQVLTGGRGKAGGVRVVSSEEQAESVADEILGMTIKGCAVQQVLVVEKLDIRAEYYAGITVDREAKSVVLIVSDAGGMDIEQIAAHQPQRVRRFTLAGGDRPQSNTLEQWLAVLFTDQALLDQVVPIVQNIYRLFRDKDCSLVEINPLALTAQGRLIAADAKIVFDDNALWRHPDIARLRNAQEYTADELQAKEAGLSFVTLSGEIGCMVNGAGLAMATMDGIKLAGGRAANFLDVGGSSNPDKVLNAMRILLRNRRLKVILVNIFGGITRCDDVAQGILMARQHLGISVPMVVRLVGTNEQEARDMLRRGLSDAKDAAGRLQADLIVASEMTDAISKAVNLAQEGGRE